MSTDPTAASIFDNARWMTEIQGDIQDQSFADIASIGTHNSATYNITGDSIISRDAPDVMQDLEDSCFGSASAAFSARFSACQNYSVYDQLRIGVRFFDLRVVVFESPEDREAIEPWEKENEGKKGDERSPRPELPSDKLPPNERIVCAHGFHGVPLCEVVADVIRFLDEGRAAGKNGEVIVFDIAKLIGFDRPEDHADLTAVLRPLEEYMIRRRDGNPSPCEDTFDIVSPIGEILAQPDEKKRVFVFHPYFWTDQSAPADHNPEEPFTTFKFHCRDLIESEWPQKNAVGDLVDFVKGQLTEFRRQRHAPVEEVKKHLRVTQCILTVTGQNIARSLAPCAGCLGWPTSLSEFVDEVNAATLAAIEEDTDDEDDEESHFNGRKVVLVDFAGDDHRSPKGHTPVELCININKRNAERRRRLKAAGKDMIN